ncbi:MAG: hypothetical protein ACYC5Q_12190 [Thermoleophilia bacterium]
MTSVLGPAALVLLVAGLAVWTVTQLTGGEAAAERLPPIVVGRDVTAAGEPAVLQPAGIPPTGSTVGGMTLETASVGGGTGTSRTTVRTSTTAPTSTGTTMPTASGPAGGGGQSTATSTTATTRMVVPDPVREHEGGHTGGGMSTPGSMGTTPGGMGMTPGGMSTTSTSGGSGMSGSMGH